MKNTQQNTQTILNPFDAIIKELHTINTKICAIGDKLDKVTHQKQDYSKKELAKIINKSISWIDNKRMEGTLKWFMVGGQVRIPASELKKFQYSEG